MSHGHTRHGPRERRDRLVDLPESDGQPVAETNANLVQMLDLIWALKILSGIQGRAETTAVGGNQFVYYNPHNGRDNISPDVYVVFDYGPYAPPSWKTWLEGKFPDVVFEITSPSTHAQDLSRGPKGKLRLYAELGAKEYYIYDPQGETEPPFLGFEARAGRMEPLPLSTSGGIVSPLLGTELRPIEMEAMRFHIGGVWLRVIDPTTGRPIPFDVEMYPEYLKVGEEREARLAAEQARLAAERRARGEEKARLLSERARLAAEERAARAEAALQALLADMERGQGPEAQPKHE